MFHAIVNPTAKSGRGRIGWEKTKEALDQHKIKYIVHFTAKHGDASSFATDLYNEIVVENQDRLSLLILGGDGTLNEVIQGLPGLDNVSISFIPIGSSNDLARGLGISFNVEEAVNHLITKPTTLYMDMGTIHCENALVRDGAMSIPDRRFLVSAGIGFDASVCHEALSSKIKDFLNKLRLGKLSYLMICLKQLLSITPATAELTIDNQPPFILNNLVVLAAMNNMYEGGGFKFAPTANNADGKVNIMTVSDVSKPRLLFALPKTMPGNHLDIKGVGYYEATQFTLRTSEPMWVHTDGEVEEKADFISVKILKEAIKIVY